MKKVLKKIVQTLWVIVLFVAWSMVGCADGLVGGGTDPLDRDGSVSTSDATNTTQEILVSDEDNTANGLDCSHDLPVPPSKEHCECRWKNCEATRLECFCDLDCYGKEDCLINSDVNGQASTDDDFLKSCDIDCEPEDDSAHNMYCSAENCVVPEQCNGKDDNFDGQTDEGFPDSDNNGVADCMENDCELELPKSEKIKIDPNCVGTGPTEVQDPWNLKIEWQYDTSDYGVLIMPAVGNLNDDNNDGQVNENDIPDIVITASKVSGSDQDGRLIALSGDGSGVLFEKTGFLAFGGGVAIADVDSDNRSEVIAFLFTGAYSYPDCKGRIAALDGLGNIKWQSEEYQMSPYPQPTVADLNEDGEVEVIADNIIVEGRTGKLIAKMEGIEAAWWRTPVVGDIDRNGKQEIILGENVFDDMGKLKWSIDTSNNGRGCFSAIANIDNDDHGEIFFLTGSKMKIYEPDGTHIRTIDIPGTNPGAPAIADFDGDGQVEMAIPANTRISMFELDGTERWNQPISDISGLAACSGFDANGDGIYEILYADEYTFYIFDGTNGTVLYSDDTHSSRTVWDYPVIADIDQDGSAEIVVSQSSFGNEGYLSGIVVYGHVNDQWPKSGETWGIHDFAVSNINNDGTVPQHPEAPWLKYNIFRARPSVDNPGTPDLEVEFLDSCVGSCVSGPVKISFLVKNQGGAIARNVKVSLYSKNNGVETLIATVEIADIPAGQTAASEFVIQPSDLGNEGLILRVDDPGDGVGLITECNEDNNQAVWTEKICVANQDDM